MIELDNVSKSYGEVRALRALSLHVPAGKTTVLIGPSGCGKSTVLRLIIGLIRADDGTVRFEGTPVTPENAGRLRLKMGYVIQEGGLFPHMTARRNVTLMARQLDHDESDINNRIDELSELVQLPTSRLSDYPAQLSGGQRQRVSLMRALMLDPDVLLLDEPLGALDPMIRASLQDDLKNIFRKLGKTVVLVTHDISEAAFFADRIVLLKQGTIIQEGRPSELINAPSHTFVEEFIRAQRPPLAFDEDARL
jgi:osmoprotectant transport system ATP-binding protein